MYFETDSGARLRLDESFELNGTVYPSNWLRMTSDAEKAQLGITPIESVRLDSSGYETRYRYADGTEKDMDLIKQSMIKDLRNDCKLRLQKTDWYVIRQAEGLASIPPAVAERRAQIRQWCSNRENLINAATTLEELQAL